MKTMATTPCDSETILYQSSDVSVGLQVRLENETVWLTQKQIAELFGTEVPAISKHIRNIFSSGELQPTATVSKMEIVQQEGFTTSARRSKTRAKSGSPL